MPTQCRSCCDHVSRTNCNKIHPSHILLGTVDNSFFFIYSPITHFFSCFLASSFVTHKPVANKKCKSAVNPSGTHYKRSDIQSNQNDIQANQSDIQSNLSDIQFNLSEI